jgi:16S rRNA processing protein RimM
MLTLQECIKIGVFRKPQGFAGTIHLQFEPEWAASVKLAKRLIAETNGLPVPWFVTEDGIRITSPHTALVDLEWTEDKQSAENLSGLSVYLLKEDIVSQDEITDQDDWKGYQVKDERGAHIGTVRHSENYSGNLVLILETPNGEKMIPLHEDLILDNDPSLRIIQMSLPEGLLDI